jgi:capsular polysaccharide biosynthesis protein
VSPQYETWLRESRYWSPDQYVDAGELAGSRRVELVEPAAVPRIGHLRRHGDRVWRPEDYRELPSETCPGPGYTLLEDVRLVSPGMALAADGRFVDDPLTRLNPGRLSPDLERDLVLGAEGRAAWPDARGFVERGICIPGHDVNAYGHQLLDFLPGLGMLDEFDAFAGWPVLVPSHAPPWVPALVAAFSGSRELRYVSHRRGRKLRVGRLCVPWVPRHPAFHPAVAGVFERVVEAAREEAGGGGLGRRIWIVRPDQNVRRLTNASEVESALAARGFATVVPERLRFDQQVRLFAAADIVAGEAGSGLHGTVFSQPGTITLELRPETYFASGQPAIAVLRRQTFTSLTGVQGGAGRMSREPWTIDPRALEGRLADLGLG